MGFDEVFEDRHNQTLTIDVATRIGCLKTFYIIADKFFVIRVSYRIETILNI